MSFYSTYNLNNLKNNFFNGWTNPVYNNANWSQTNLANTSTSLFADFEFKSNTSFNFELYNSTKIFNNTFTKNYLQFPFNFKSIVHNSKHKTYKNH